MKNPTKKTEEQIRKLWYKHCKDNGFVEVHPSNIVIESKYAHLYNINGEIGRYDLKNNRFVL